MRLNSRSCLKDIGNKIAEVNAEENFNYIEKNVEHLAENTDNVNSIKMWQLKKKLCSKKAAPPTVKKNENGVLVTEPNKLKELNKTTYMKRLEH